MSILLENLKAVSLNKIHIRSVALDVENSFAKCLWIPARKKALAILTMLEQTSTVGENSSVTFSIFPEQRQELFAIDNLTSD